MPRIEELYWELDVRSAKLNEGVDRAEKRLQKFAAFIKAHPVVVLGALGAAFIATGIAAAKFAEQVDSHLRRVDALLPRTTTGVDRMRQRLVELAKVTPVPLETLAQGLEDVVRQGERDPDRAFQKLAAAAKLAQIAGVELGESITLLDGVMDAFNIKTEHAGDVLDILTVAAQRGTPLQELAPVLGQVGAQAQAAGLRLGDIVATINTLQERGIPVRQAIQVIRESIERLRGAQSDADDMSRGLGLRLDIVGGRLKFAGQGADEFNGALQEMEARGGRADQMLGKINDSLGGQSELLRNQVKAAWLELGTTAAPVLLGIQKLALETLEFWTGAAQRGLVGTAIRDLGTAFKQLPTNANAGINSMLGALKDLSEELQGLREDGTRFEQAFVNKFIRVGTASREEIANAIKALQALDEAHLRSIGLTVEARQQLAQRLGDVLRQLPPAPSATGAGGGAGAGDVPLDPEALRKRAELREALVRQLASLTSSVADDLTAQLTEFERRVAETFGTKVPADITRMLVQLRATIKGTQSFEEMDRVLERIEQRVTRITDAFGEVPVTLGLEILPELDNLIAQLLAARDAQARGTTLWKQYDEQLTRAVELSKKVAANIGKAGNEQARVNAELDATLDKLELQASRIQSAVRGALQLGQAFGLLDEQTSAMLQHITQIATEIPKVTAVLKAGGSFEKALPGLLSIAGGLAGLLGGLFREDPEEKQRREILRQNTEAIRELTQRIGEAFLDVTGAEFAAAREAAGRALQNRDVQNILAGNESHVSGRRRRDRERAGAAIQREFAAAGISMAELREIAEQLGLSLAGAIPTARELQQIAEALASTELTRFAQTFAGQVELLAREFELFDITEPLDQLKRLREIALGFADSPLIEALFGGLDLTTPEGRAALEARIRELYGQLQAGTLTPEQLGGLTPQQLLELLSQLEATMDRVAEGAEQGQTAQFQVTRQITEVTGMRLASLLTTSLIWQQQIAENTAGILALLGGGNGALRPPTFAELAGYNPDGVTIEGDLVIQVSVPGAPSSSEAQRIGSDVGRAAAAALDRELGKTYRRRALLRGNVTRN